MPVLKCNLQEIIRLMPTIKPTRGILLGAVLSAVGALGLSAPLPAMAIAPTSSNALVQLPDFVKLVEENGPAVVNIQSIRKARTIEHGAMPGMDPRAAEIFRHFGFPFDFDFPGSREIPEQRGTGSGFIISSDGLIMTNAHVVDKADTLLVRLTDKREFKGKVLGVDKQTDIAIVKIQAKNLPTLKIGNSNELKVGQWVAAIGSPFGLDNTVTAGIVSALSRNLPSDQYVPFIQTDVAVNPGNSGGPLFNMNGEVVGINSQIFSTSGGFMGLSFAIPIDLAMKIKDQLVKDGRVTRGYLGVYIQEITQDLASGFGLKTPQGALVTKTEKGSPAQEAGLQSGDVIIAVNGKKVTSSATLPLFISTMKPGTTVSLKIIRDGKEKTVNAKIGTNKNARDQAIALENKSRLGVTVRTLTPKEIKEQETTGLLITSVSGLAAKAGLREGDIIVNANGKSLKTRDDLIKVCKLKRVVFLVQRKDGRFFVPITFPAKK